MSELPDSPDSPETSPTESSDDPADQETYHGYSVDDETQTQSTGDSLVAEDRDVVEPMEEGWNPPEGWSAAQGYGNTPLEEELGETLDQRVAQEVPEPDPYRQAEEAELRQIDEQVGADGASEGGSPEVGDDLAGRLVAPDEGVREDDEAALLAQDVGIDGSAPGAEEAAVHVIEEGEGPA